MKKILKNAVLWVDNNSWTLFLIGGWIFPIIMCFLPEKIAPFFLPLIFGSVAAIIISMLYFAFCLNALLDDLWKRIVKKCKK